MDIPSSISFVTCSLSKNFILVGASLEVCQDLSSSECNLHISPNDKCVSYTTIILFAGLSFILSEANFLGCLLYLFYLLSFLYAELLESSVCRVCLGKALKHICLRVLLNLYVCFHKTLFKCFAKKGAVIRMST